MVLKQNEWWLQTRENTNKILENAQACMDGPKSLKQNLTESKFWSNYLHKNLVYNNLFWKYLWPSPFRKTYPSCINIVPILSMVLKWHSSNTSVVVMANVSQVPPTTCLHLSWCPSSTLSLSYYEFTDRVLVGSVAALVHTMLGKELFVKAVGCMVVATWFSLFISSCHPGTFLAVICLLACLVKWSDLINRRPQRGQANRFSPVCVRLCLANSSDLAKRLSQFSQVQGKGFSPEMAQK